VENDFYIFVPFNFFNLKFIPRLLVPRVIQQFKVSVAFRFRVNQRYGQTDGRTWCNALFGLRGKAA